jgi:methionine synthase II (cobalamin-independent)
MLDDTYLIGTVGITHEHPFVEHFRFVKGLETSIRWRSKTIPSPAQFLAQFTMPFNRDATEKWYSNDEQLIDDIVSAYSKVIDDLYAVGCRNLQLDDCTWGMLADKTATFCMERTQLVFLRYRSAIRTQQPCDCASTGGYDHQHPRVQG